MLGLGEKRTTLADRFLRCIRQFLQDLEKKDSEIEASAASMSFEQICKQNQSAAQSDTMGAAKPLGVAACGQTHDALTVD